MKARPDALAGALGPLTTRVKEPPAMARPFIDSGLTAKQLRAVLRYEPETGMFIWRRRKQGDHFNSWAGLRAGAKRDLGYIVIRIDYRLYRAHRLAWLYVFGKWPKGEIDHINGDPSDNRIANLRLASSSDQKINSRLRKDNTSGYKGVWFEKRRNHWVAEIMVDGKKRSIGSFPTAEAAKAERDNLARHLHGKFARTD